MTKAAARLLVGLALASSQAFAQAAPPRASQPPQANQSDQTVQADLTRQFSTAMGAIAGRQTTFGDLYGVGVDCTPLDWSEVIIVRPPQHGRAQVISRNETIGYADTNPRKICNGRLIAAKALTYTPDGAYSGADTMVVRRVSSNGVMQTVTYNITVLQPSETASDKAAPEAPAGK